MTNLIREIAGPGDLRQLHREYPTRYPFLLQSTAPGGSLGRFDILFASPGDALVAGDTAGFLDALDECWQAARIGQQQESLPFLGGWFLYLGYELAGEIETGLRLTKDPVLPAAFAVRCPAGLIYDHETSTCNLVSETPDSVDREQLLADIGALATVQTVLRDGARKIHFLVYVIQIR